MIYTDEMIIEEAKKHPDFKKNEKIWEEIRNGKFDNIKKLTFITNELVGILIENNIDLNLSGLQSAQGLKLPETMNGYLVLRGLQSAEGLKLPETMNGGLYLDGLKPPITETAIKYLAEYEGCKKTIHFNTAVRKLIDEFRKKKK